MRSERDATQDGQRKKSVGALGIEVLRNGKQFDVDAEQDLTLYMQGRYADYHYKCLLEMLTSELRNDATQGQNDRGCGTGQCVHLYRHLTDIRSMCSRVWDRDIVSIVCVLCEYYCNCLQCGSIHVCEPSGHKRT